MSQNILLVEDDPAIAQTIQFALSQAGFDVAHHSKARSALEHLETAHVDLIVLDVGLPDLSGFEVCRRLRAMPAPVGTTPVLFLTAHVEEIDRVQGFELGADDYLAKPFSPRELVSRIRAILRRSQPLSGATSTSSALSAGAIRLWPEQLRVEVSSQAISLTRTEFKLLETLMSAPKRVYSRDQLLDSLQGPGSPTGDRAVDTHIKTLRAKLQEVDRDLDPIVTHRGVGYSFNLD